MIGKGSNLIQFNLMGARAGRQTICPFREYGVCLFYAAETSECTLLGKPSYTNSAVFFNIVQTAFDPPSPPRFEHVCCKFF